VSYYKTNVHKPFIYPLKIKGKPLQRKPALLAMDRILEVLRNGEWHELKEVSAKSRLQESKVEMITSFLAEYDFLKFDKKNNRIKLSPQMLQFLRRIEDVEGEFDVEHEKSSIRSSNSLETLRLFDVDSLA